MNQQQVDYDDLAALEKALEELRQLPPLVTEGEIITLKAELALAQQGDRFILQGGDCAEQFSECNAIQIANKFKILLQMSVVLIHGLKKPVIRVGRIAGQYAKPRSNQWEERDGQKLLAYRGDIINDAEFTPQARLPDPKRMREAYFRSGVTLNYLRALAEGGFADLHHPENWELPFMRKTGGIHQYHQILGEIRASLHSFKSITGDDSLARVKLFTSHEALHLPYEAALTRLSQDQKQYNLGTHFPWVGMRTLALAGAHVNYLSTIHNPIGIKVGPDADFDELARIIDKLNPQGEIGKIMLIHRFGRAHIAEKLPRLLKQMRAMPVLLTCDPMHGNTKMTAGQIKTRYFEDILEEIKLAFEIHGDAEIPLSGIHFEMTGDNVTECIGGACGLKEKDLKRSYTSLVDPRLNYEQALEMALKIAEMNRKF